MVNQKECAVLNSELSVKVMQKIAEKSEGDYGSNLARKLDKSQASIGRVINELRETGFLKKGKRERAQYYELDYKRISEYWYNKINSGLENSEDEINRKKWLVEGYTTKEKMLEGMSKHEDEIKSIYAEYIEKVLKSNSSLENMDVHNLLFESFAYSIGHNMIKEENFLKKNKELEYPKDALVHLYNLDGYARELRNVLNS